MQDNLRVVQQTLACLDMQCDGCPPSSAHPTAPPPRPPPRTPLQTPPPLHIQTQIDCAYPGCFQPPLPFPAPCCQLCCERRRQLVAGHHCLAALHQHRQHFGGCLSVPVMLHQSFEPCNRPASAGRSWFNTGWAACQAQTPAMQSSLYPASDHTYLFRAFLGRSSLSSSEKSSSSPVTHKIQAHTLDSGQKHKHDALIGNTVASSCIPGTNSSLASSASRLTS